MLVEKIDFDQLKKMAIALNTAVYEDAEGKEATFLKTKLKTIAISKENLAKNFDAAIKGISDEVVNELPEPVIDFFNEFFSDEAAAAPAAAAPAPAAAKAPAAAAAKPEKAVKAPKEKVVKEPKEKKVAELSCFGHKLGTQAAALDDLINAGKAISVEELAKKSGRSPLGVKGHIKHLRTDRGLKIDEKDGTYILVK